MPDETSRPESEHRSGFVTFVGRPNVGKSTLLNRIVGKRVAIVEEKPGVTRDRHYGICRLNPEHPFIVCDTGGLSGDDEGLAGATAKQSWQAASEAAVIVFVVDAKSGPEVLDFDILAGLRKLGAADNTLVWFNSDNGGLPGITPGTVGNLRGFKGSVYEGGLRVPFLARWPGKIPAGTVRHGSAITMDILPTLLDAAGGDGQR